MKQKQKTLLLLLGAAVVLGAAFAVLSLHNQQQAAAESQAAEQAVVHVVSGLEVSAINYTYQSETMELTQSGEEWQLAGDPDFTLNKAVTANMAQQFSDMVANRELNWDATADYGFDTPTMTVTATSGDGSITLIWGDKNTVTGDYYLQKQGQEEVVYTVSSSTVQAFEYSRAELYSGITLQGADDVTAFRLEKADGSAIEFERTEQEANSAAPVTEQTDEPVYCWQTAAGEVNQDTADKALNAVCGQTTQWAYTDITADTDLTAYGFGADSLTLTLTLSDGSQKTLMVGSEVDGLGNRCVTEPGSSVVYGLTASAVAPLDTDFAAYLTAATDESAQAQ